jgi:hypothetical protein
LFGLKFVRDALSWRGCIIAFQVAFVPLGDFFRQPCLMVIEERLKLEQLGAPGDAEMDPMIRQALTKHFAGIAVAFAREDVHVFIRVSLASEVID